MTEERAALEAAVTRLKADTAIVTTYGAKVYGRLAEKGAAPPYVVVTVAPSRDLANNGTIEGKRVLTHVALDVIAVIKNEGSAELAYNLADRIDVVMTSFKDLVIGGKRVIGSIRLAPIDFDAVQSGVWFSHVGGQYRVETSL